MNNFYLNKAKMASLEKHKREISENIPHTIRAVKEIYSKMTKTQKEEMKELAGYPKVSSFTPARNFGQIDPLCTVVLSQTGGISPLCLINDTFEDTGYNEKSLRDFLAYFKIPAEDIISPVLPQPNKSVSAESIPVPIIEFERLKEFAVNKINASDDIELYHKLKDEDILEQLSSMQKKDNLHRTTDTYCALLVIKMILLN